MDFLKVIYENVEKKTVISKAYLYPRLTDRSSRPVVFCKKGVLRHFTKFTRKHLCQSLFFK